MSPFQNKLKRLMHEYVKLIYTLTKKFPKDEIYGSISQVRRAALSISLNYIEGYCRRRNAVKLNMYEISYGSLGESRYICYLALDLQWITKDDYAVVEHLSEEIGAMLWSEIESAEENIKLGR